MVQRKAPAKSASTRSRPRARKVIDVGDEAPKGEADEDAGDKDDDKDADGEAEHEVDAADELAGARVDDGDVIDVGSDSEGGSGDDNEHALALAEARAEAKASRGGSLARRDPMAAYMQEARRFPLLSPDDEHALAVRLVEHGDTGAARKLVEANLRLVVKIAYEYRRAHRNLLDLVQEGNIGLIQAVGKFDPYRGVKLSSYAAFWIRAYILKFILNNWRLVKIGTTQAQRKLFFNLRKEREKLEQLGFQPTSAMLAEKLDVTEAEVVEMEKRLAAPEASLDAPYGDDDGGSRTRLDTLPSNLDRPNHNVEKGEFQTILKNLLDVFAKSLAGRDEVIFRERWLTDEPKTLQDLGDQYGISRERARQLEKRLLDKLKKYLQDELGSAVDIDSFARE